MAYIAFSQGKWRAQVQKLGVRSSKSFATKEEAERWVEVAEQKIAKDIAQEQEAPSAELLPYIPRRVLRAIRAVPYSHQELIQCAMPLSSRVCGVYFLIRDGEVVYVGQSVNVLGRLTTHAAKGKKFDAVSVIKCSGKDAAKKAALLEAQYIMALMPEENQNIAEN